MPVLSVCLCVYTYNIYAVRARRWLLETKHTHYYEKVWKCAKTFKSAKSVLARSKKAAARLAIDTYTICTS